MAALSNTLTTFLITFPPKNACECGSFPFSSFIRIPSQNLKSENKTAFPKIWIDTGNIIAYLQTIFKEFA